ncbi:MAG: exodeoxyribonuclease III [Gammaproteobacteria bacterium]
MKIASWNVNSLRVRLPQVLEWLNRQRPDVLALQETKTTDEQFPVAEIETAGYRVVYSGQKTYNGVAILATGELSDTVADLPGVEDPQRRLLAATCAGVRIVNVYVPNGSEVGSDKYAYKLEWLGRLTDYLQEELRQHERLVLLGDFNIAPEDRDVHDPKAWEGKVLCSEPEREAFRRLVGLGLVDTFRQFSNEGGAFSWWDYRMNGFRRNLGLRIDHILASRALSERATASIIDKEPRGWERPSDHAPVVAEFNL